ncbi:hypothetical protein ACWPKS_08580 [Coraliomargarita sp. W4R72]
MKNEITAYTIYAFGVVLIHFLVYKSEGGALGLMGFLPAVALFTINRRTENDEISETFRLKKGNLLSLITTLLFVAAGITWISKVEDIDIVVDALVNRWVLTLMCLGYLAAGLSAIFKNRKSDQGGVINSESLRSST